MPNLEVEDLREEEMERAPADEENITPEEVDQIDLDLAWGTGPGRPRRAPLAEAASPRPAASLGWRSRVGGRSRAGGPRDCSASDGFLRRRGPAARADAGEYVRPR